MFRWPFSARLRSLCWIATLISCATAHAQAPTPLLDEVQTVAEATVSAPIQHSFDISVAGDYTLTLVDEGATLTPSAPVSAVALAVTSGDAIVGTPLAAAGTLKFTATVGTYVIHLVGTPGTVPGSGLLGIQVAGPSSSTVVASFSDSIAPPATTLPSNEVVIDDSFTVTTAGSYTIALTDLQLPQALTTLTMIVTQPDGTVVTNPPLASAGSVAVNLQPGTYDIFGVGESDPTVNAGLYSASVVPTGGGPAIYVKVVPVGTVVAATPSTTLTAGTSYTVQLTDLAFPVALTQVAAVLTADGQAAVAPLTAAGQSAPFVATSATYQPFVLASTAATGGYALSVAPSTGPAAISVARAVSVPGGASTAYSFDSNLSTAGAYTLNLTDFGLPSPLSAVSLAAVQNGVVLGTALKAAGSQNVTAAAGPVSFLMFAQAATGGGLVDFNLTPGAGGSAVFDATQGVGQLFDSRQISVTSAGSYAVNVNDLSFPDPLATFAVIVTQGGTQIGSIVGGGAFSFPATAGKYNLNFIAQPGGATQAGTYAMTVAPAPVVSLTSSASSVASGGTVTLTWTSANATTCAASDGWTGTQTLNGTAATAAITTATTFTLTCTGTGVSVMQSVNVTVDAAPAKSGGGGKLSGLVLLALFGALLMRQLSIPFRGVVREHELT
jgi:hypothetical protein